MQTDTWDGLDRWAQELITWVYRESPDIQESNIILRLFVKDGVLYKVEQQRSNTRNKSRELLFEDDLKNPFAT